MTTAKYCGSTFIVWFICTD